VFKKRFAGDKLQSDPYAGNDSYHNGMHRRDIDKYDLGFDFPVPASDIYKLNLIAEKITAERGEPMTYENIRRNGIDYFENTNGRLSMDPESFLPSGKEEDFGDPNDPDFIPF